MKIPRDWAEHHAQLRVAFAARPGAQADWCAAVGIANNTAGHYVGRSVKKQPLATKAFRSFAWLDREQRATARRRA